METLPTAESSQGEAPCVSVAEEPGVGNLEVLLLNSALNFHRLGFNVMPCPRGSKEPPRDVPWGHLQFRRQTESDIRQLFAGHQGNLAVIAGKASGNLAVYDAETRDEYERAKDFVRRVGGEKCVCAVRSARGGHVYFRTPQPVRGEQHKEKGFEIKGHGGYLLAPPSLHPSGVAYEFEGDWRDIPLIEDWPGCELAPIARTSRLAKRILGNDPATIAKYKSRSEVDCALILSLHQSGFGEEEILRRLASSKHDSHIRPGKSAGVPSSGASAIVEIRRVIEKFGARPWPGVEQIQRLRLWADTRIWHGRTGPNELTVFLGHLKQAEKAHRLDGYAASVRDLAKTCRLSPKTVCNANAKLMKIGCIKRERPTSKSRSMACSFSLVLPTEMDKPATLHHINESKLKCGRFVHHAVFETSGLGPATGLIYRHLPDPSQPPLSIDQLAQATGRCSKTIGRNLQRLLKYKLARETDSGFTKTAQPPDLDELARTLGVDANAARRAQRVAMERASHSESLDQIQCKGGLMALAGPTKACAADGKHSPFHGRAS